MKATLYSLLMLSLLPIAVSGVAVIRNSNISLEAEPNDAPIEANEIILGTEFRGTKGSDVDWFTFTVSSSNVVSLSFKGAMADGDTPVLSISINDSKYNKLWEGVMRAENTAQIGLSSPGTYFVCITSRGGYSGYIADYRCTVSVTAAEDQPVSAAKAAVLNSQLNAAQAQLNGANALSAGLQAQLTAAHSKITDLEAEIANLREGQSNSNEGGGLSLGALLILLNQKPNFEGWNYHQWPWVYNDKDKDWHYYHSAPSGWAVWRHKDNKWYSFNASTKTWSTQ
jgi:hypothetical protein